MDVKNVDLFFSDNPNPMWIYDPSDRSIQEVNHSALELYGYSYDEMCSMTIEELRPASEVGKLKEHLSKDKRKGFDNAGVWHHQKKNGDALFVRVLTTPVSYEGNDYKLVVVQDVTSKIDYQQKYEMLFEHSLDGVMLTNPNGDILQANKAACEILGMTEEEIISKGRDGIVAKDEKLEKALEQRSETGKFSGELTYIHKSGCKIPVELTTSVFTNYKGERWSSLIFRDISERKETEKALHQEKEFIDIILTSLPGIFFVLNSEGEVIRWNDYSTEVFGLSPDEIEGRPAEEFVHEDDKEFIRQEIIKVFESGHTRVELKINTAGEGNAFYDFIANIFQQNGNVYIVGSGVNITKQKELEEKLQDALQEEHNQRVQAEGARDKLKEMFEKAPSPKCMLVGPELRFSLANKSYCELVGQQDIVGKRLTDVIPEIEQQGYVDILKQVYRSGEPYIGTEDPIKINKEQEGAKTDYILNILYKPLFDDEGDVYGIFAEGIDISDQLSYQRQLEESLKEKETLLHEVHHRVKNNLAVVSGMMQLQILREEDEILKQKLNESVSRIQTIGSIHELLYQSNSFSRLNLDETIKKLIRDIAHTYQPAIVLEINFDLQTIDLNINQAIPASLILNEVITNVFKYAFDEKSQGRLWIKMTETNNTVYLQITDNGKGLPADFKVTDSTNSLGLKLIDTLTQQLKGDYKYESDDGKTHFKLRFKKADIKGSSSAFLDD